MQKLVILFSLCLFTFSIKGQERIEKAKNYIQVKHYKSACRVLTKYIKTEKDTQMIANAYYWLGETYYWQYIDKKPAVASQKAFEQYSKGLNTSKNNPLCLVGMGKLLLNQKNEKEALKTFDTAIRSSKSKNYKEGDPYTYMYIGDTYLNCLHPNLEQAMAYFSRARDIEPKSKLFWEKMNNPKFKKLAPHE
ncbi:MAG: hypothetical protein JNL70_13670 [Saprospiraceae bacterium]|nr:hypothetical protein [Saprospiraceae bacterium]